MNQLEIQMASTSKKIPSEVQFQTWVDTELKDNKDNKDNNELVIRIVDGSESAELNQCYRHKEGATNILSFPFEAPEMINSPLLGDLVICAPIIEQQAEQQHKALFHHWAHIIIHGVLHLCGYDHLSDADAQIMESKEIILLKKLSIHNPYQEQMPHE